MGSFAKFLKEDNDAVVDYTTLDPIVIAPGRFNPPHRGHQLMIKELINLSAKYGAEPVVIIVDAGKYDERNPLTGEQRKKYLEQMFSNIRIEIARNPYDAVEQLRDRYVPVGGVTGADRADSYKKMVGRLYNEQVEEQYEAKVLSRDPDADDGDVAGISATKVRQAAANNDLPKFRAMTGLGGLASEEMMAAVRKGMGVE